MSNTIAVPLRGADTAPAVLKRLLTHVTRQKDGCWIWTRATDRDGYGKTNLAGRSVGAHRAMYQVVVGPIPKGHHLHHECETKPCVNTTHLKPLTPAEHNRVRAAAQTHCKHGHEFTKANTYRRPDTGTRGCRRCIADRSAAYQARKKTA